MKKLVVVLFVLCSMLFITNPIFKSSFANNESKVNNKVTSSNNDNLDNTKPHKTLETNDETKLISTNEKSDIKDIKAKENNASNDINSKETSNNNLEERKETSNNLDNNNEQINVSKEETINEPIAKVEETINDEQITASQSLTMEEALKLLMDMNPNLVYEYKGDENKFPVLKNKGLYGYVFLPKIDTDLGYFVDKNTSSIYYFHPSGYLEKIK